MPSPGLYSATDAMTSIPGAPVRSVRFCSTRCGESVIVCATKPVATPRPNKASPAMQLDNVFLFVVLLLDASSDCSLCALFARGQAAHDLQDSQARRPRDGCFLHCL